MACNGVVPSAETDGYEIRIFFDTEELSPGKTTTQKFARMKSTSGLSPDSIVAISSDPSIATAEISSDSDSSYIYYTITALSAGTAYIHFETVGGAVCSGKIEITVLPDTCGTLPSTDDTATNESTDPTATATSGGIDAPATSSTTTETDDGTTATVYITPTGSKYHLIKECAGKNAIEKSLDEISASYDPCKKCAS